MNARNNLSAYYKMREGYLSDSAVLKRCIAMQSVPLGRPDLAVRIGSKTVYPQNAQMMYSNLRFDRETKLNLISDFVDRSRAQPQPIPPIATGIPPAPAAIPPAPAAIPPIPPDTLMGLGEEEDGSDSDSGDTPLQSLPDDDFSEIEITPEEVAEFNARDTSAVDSTLASDSRRTIPEDSPMVSRPSFSPAYRPFEPRSPDADQPTGDSPIGRARDELGRLGRNSIFRSAGVPRTNSSFAQRAGSRVSATLRDVFSTPSRIVPSTQPQAELTEDSTPRTDGHLDSRIAIRRVFPR